MNFYPIVSIKYLNHLAALSHYHMVLAHWLVEPEYRDFYRLASVDSSLIMDNGCCELGVSIPLDKLMAHYESLAGLVDVVVVPDTKGEGNIELFNNSVATMRKSLGKHTRLMGVPQSIPDLEYMSHSTLIDFIGLTRDWGTPGYNRSELIGNYPRCGKRFHLLGMYRDPITEVLSVKKFGKVVSGIDSSLPFRLVTRMRRIKECRPFPDVIDMYEKVKTSAEVSFMKQEFKEYIKWVERI